MKQDDPTNPCVRVHLDSLVLRHATGER
jgi:hypothetical protein